MDENAHKSRRHVLECMVWAGTGVLWTVAGGIPRSALMGTANAQTPAQTPAQTSAFSFMQISDSHIGFARDANSDTPSTLTAGIEMIRALPAKPAMMLHTGDVSHLSKPVEFDVAEKIIGTSGLETHFVPGEHDVLEDGTKPFIERFQKGVKQGAAGGAFYSFDQGGVHFVGLNNVIDLKAGGLGYLGPVQLAWLEADLKDRTASTPIVVFAHIPLWTVYEQWGWGTDDGAKALALLKRFGSVTVLNGHIHQVMQKVEGNIAFHTARSLAFPQPAPGTAPSPGPMKVEAGRLRSVLGIASVSVIRGQSPLAIVDTPLGA